MHKSKTFEELTIGDIETHTVTIQDKHIKAFAEATGDFNPIHMDEEYASSSQFGRRIAHGVLLTGIVSGVLGTKFPGLGTVARQMDAKFSRPAFIGDTVTAEIKLQKKQEKIKMCEFSYKVSNQDGKVIVRGKAVVIPRSESQNKI